MRLFKNTKQTVMWVITGVLAVLFLAAGLYMRRDIEGGSNEARPPVLILTAKEVELHTGDKFDALAYVKQATGTDGSDLTKDVEVPDIPTDVPGEYNVTYTYTGTDPDSKASATMHVIVSNDAESTASPDSIKNSGS